MFLVSLRLQLLASPAPNAKRRQKQAAQVEIARSVGYACEVDLLLPSAVL